MSNKLARLSKSRDKAVQWLNGAPKSSTPLTGGIQVIGKFSKKIPQV